MNQSIIYTPNSLLSSPSGLIKSMLKGLISSRFLAWALFIKGVKEEYSRSVLGVFWNFSESLVTAFIFIVLMKFKAITISNLMMPYPVYIIYGFLIWFTFTDTLLSAVKMLRPAKAMLVYMKVSSEAFFLTVFYRSVFNTLFRLVVLLFLNIFYNLPIFPNFFFFSILLFFAIILGLSIGVLLAPIAVLYTDIERLITTLIRVMVYASPVIYVLPETDFFKWLSFLNPLIPVINSLREIGVGLIVTSPLHFSIVCFASIILFFISWVNYHVSMPVIIERM